MLTWFVMAGIQLGIAEEVSEAVEPEVNEAALRIEALEQQLQSLEGELRAKDDFLEHELDKVAQIRTVVDSRQALSVRRAALAVLTETHSTMVLPFIWEILGVTKEFDADLIVALPKLMSLDDQGDGLLQVRDILQKSLYLAESKPSTFTVAIGDAELVGALRGETEIRQDVAQVAIETALAFSQPEISALLYAYVEDMTIPMDLRQRAKVGLETQHATWLAQQPPLSLMAASDRLANNIYAASAAVTGSVLLGSVGVWGQNSASESIGYTGGALLGATSGWLVSQNQHPTLSQSALMASSVGWGLAQGQLLADGFVMNSGFSALSRTLGISAGAGYGYWARDRQMSLSDVLETDFAGYFGAQMAVALLDIVADQSSLQYPDYDDYITAEYRHDPDPSYQAEYDAQWEAYEAAQRTVSRANEAHQRKKFLAGSAGSLIGLGGAHLLMDAWQPTPASALFAGVWSGQMAIASSELLPAVDMTYPEGWVRLTGHASMAGALVYDHFNPVSYDQSIFSAYGASAGYLLGYGISDLFSGEYKSGQRNAALLSTIGTIGGTTLGNQMNFSTSDWVSTGVGLGIAWWHMETLGTIAAENEWITYRQAGGLVQTGMGAAGLALLGAGVKYDISSADAIFLGSTAAWGAYYGALTPIALNIDDALTGAESLALTLTASDVFLAAGSLGLFRDQIDARQTAIPQVLGVAGATVGSLGAFLFTDSSQVVSGAALLGATAGLAGGVLLDRRGTTLTQDMRLLHTPRWVPTMNVQVSPYTAESGDMGMYLGLTSPGF